MGREQLIADPRFCTNGQRVAHRQALREVLRDCLSDLSSADCIELLGQQQIVVGAVRSYSQVLASPDVQTSGILVESHAPDGSAYRAVGLPYRMGSAPRPAPDAAPSAGADSHALLSELGYCSSEIADMQRDGVIN
jgi:crotonobetainyl-CoA:carnitine CoA-transferase CaiB-like acyl-CoA transferase